MIRARLLTSALLTLGLLVPQLASATTLPELIAAADDANLDGRITREQRLRAAAELHQAWAGLLPFLSAQGTWTRNQRPVEVGPFAPGGDPIVITPEDQYDAVLRLELPLIDTVRWARVGAASIADEAAGLRQDVVRDAIRRQLAATWFAYAASLAVRDAAQRSLGVAEAQLKLQEIRGSLGAATEVELLRARAEVERGRQAVAETLSAVALTRRSLQSLTGLDVAEEATLPADDPAPDAPLPELEGKLGALPGVRASTKDAAYADAAARVARLAYLPTLSAHFTERLSNASGFAGETDSWTTGLVLGWRLDAPTWFAGNAARAGANVAALAVEKQQLTARDQLFSDWQRLTTAVQKLTSSAAQVEAARRAAQLIRDRYDVGAATQTDVIQAERDLFGAEVNQIQARAELASAHVALRISAGLPLQ